MVAKRRVLVTGLAGFTGRYLKAEMCAAGWEVHGLGTHPSDLERYHCVDLSDQAGLSQIVAKIKPHAVVHLAALAFVGHADVDAFYQVNLLGTRHLLQAVYEGAPDVGCVLLASSANVYGNATEGVLTEAAPPSPVNDYAVSKLAMEYLARLWMQRLPIVIARPFNYTGVGQSESFLLPKIVAHYRAKAPEIELGNIDVARDFSDVRAVAAAYRRLIDARPVGQVVNICSGRPHSLRGILDHVASLAGYEISVRVNPAFVRGQEVHTLSGDPSMLRAFIGDWDSPPLIETLEWMLKTEAV
jgi:GDP-6-deoxy-D-talose 4-dehydrogenase